MSKSISVPIFDGDKDYDEDENLTALREFAKKLRITIYPTPDLAASATKITRQTITRYEQSKARGSIKPRSTYLAKLSEELYFRKLQDENIEPAIVQKLLLEQINKAIDCCYRGEEKFKTWEELSNSANNLTLGKSKQSSEAKEVASDNLELSTDRQDEDANKPELFHEALPVPVIDEINKIEIKQTQTQTTRPRTKTRSRIILILLGIDLCIIFTVIAVLITAALAAEVPYGPTKGELEVIDGLTLSSTNTTPGKDIEFSFSVKNVGTQAIKIQDLGLGGRLGGKDWNEGIGISFPGITNITLQPEGIYKFKGTRAFYSTGDYFAETVVRIGGKWGGITPYPRVYFKIT